MKLSATNRIAFGQAMLVLSTLLMSLLLGLSPDVRSETLRGRARLCEFVALSTSALVSEGNFDKVRTLLAGLAQRDEDLLSVGVRRIDGELLVDYGDHGTQWLEQDDERSVETQVHVPIRAGAERWGVVELRFTPLRQTGLVGYVWDPQIQLLCFIALSCFLLFNVYLRRVLQHLDPSNAIPNRVRSALDTLTEGLLITDQKGRILLANHSFATVMGADAEQLIGHAASEFAWISGSADGGHDAWPWTRALSEEKPQPNMLLQLKPDDSGELRTFIVNASPVLGHDGRYRGVLTTFDDVTQLEQKKVELKLSMEAAEAANRAKSEFLANMSHEIRTPMNAILGFTNVLRRGIDRDITRQKKHLNTIHSSGEHLLELINDILDLSKVEAGQLDIERIPFSPHQLLADVVTVMGIRAEQKEITLSLEFDGPMPEQINSDPARLRQILANLIGNAIKFTDAGGVRVVGRFSDGPESAMLQVDVIDTGIGMSDDAMQRVFDPFAQADPSVTRRFGGTGLGLAISQRFAEALGGEITVASKTREGSTFSVTLATGAISDVALIEASPGEFFSNGVSDSETSLLRVPGARVLLADDGEENRELITMVLEEAEADVVTCENGQEAVDRVGTESFDIVLMDMQMPVMDGYTAARTLRQQGQNIPIIALTAHAMAGDEERCLDAGCSGYLTKPIDFDLLIHTIAESIGREARTPEISSVTNGDSKPVDSVPRPDVSDSEMTDDGGPIVSTLPGNKPKIRALLRMFGEKLLPRLDEMSKAFQSGEFAELAAHAHWLKGSGPNLGFGAFAEPARELEQLANSGAIAEIPDVLQHLRRLADRLQIPEPDDAELPTVRAGDQAVP